MYNIFDEIQLALRKSREVERAMDNNVNAMANIIEGRLKNVSVYILQKLKKELKSFNSHTGKWKK